MNLRTAATEPEWVLLVKRGALDSAYREYLLETRGKKLRLPFLASPLTLPLRKILTGPFLRFTLKRKLVDTEYTAVDLSEAFLLFWKHPNSVGNVLIRQAFKHFIQTGKVPLRGLIWYAHWLTFQGSYAKALFLFRKLNKLTVSEPNLRAEWLVLLGNFYFVRGNSDRASKYFERSHNLLSENKNTFGQMFNLGLWVLVPAVRGELENLEKIMSHFDSLNPQEPDERYGLRLLSVSAYLHMKYGNADLGNRFLQSADRVAERTGSELDRSIYFIFKSLIDILSGNQNSSMMNLNRASEALKRFGTYRYYEELIATLRLQFSNEGAQATNRITRNFNARKAPDLHMTPIALLDTPASAPASSAEDWYRIYFEQVLPQIEQCEEMNQPDLIALLKRQSLAKRVSASWSEATASVKPQNITTLTPEGALLQFNLIHRGLEGRFEILSPFLPWRNQEIFVALKSLIQSLQSTSFYRYYRQFDERMRMTTELASMARQLAHDIRSPLSAINLLVGSISNLEEERRELMNACTRRINAIASDLLKKDRNADIVPITEPPATIDVLVQQIVKEKQLEYSSRDGVNIRFQSHVRPGLKSQADIYQLQTILSNLINNSFEAIAVVGEVEVEINEYSETLLEIMVRDNGCGLSRENLEILLRAGGDSFKKTGGNGIGLKHAIRTVKDWGGQLTITSVESRGTSVRIQIPFQETGLIAEQAVSESPLIKDAFL